MLNTIHSPVNRLLLALSLTGSGVIRCAASDTISGVMVEDLAG